MNFEQGSITGTFEAGSVGITASMTAPTPVLRWNSGGVLQQEWETYEYVGGFARSRTTEWRDVPAEDEA